ncbi:TPM domain-containing protein [Maribacter sp. 2307ULW6-5]|uniref:TPM domain-containing protein n=1 Tax=Maribacter sp. 2307ULW6-5 TaxID=3386275 RepID=UPI0039BCC5F9
MSQVEDFLSSTDEAEIVEAIIAAEQRTSGEIRVHLEAHTDLDPYERAKAVFHLLKMDNTKEENGVLLYVAVQDKKFVICVDKGIDRAVPDNFWEGTRDVIQEHFKKGQFKTGIVQGILRAGEALQAHFPYKKGDQNELSDEVSKA